MGEEGYGRRQELTEEKGARRASATGEEGKVGNRILSHGIQFSTIKRNEKWIKWRPHRLRLRALCPPISLMDARP
jgi:hypothetical protein